MIRRAVLLISDQLDRGCRAGAVMFFAAMVVLVMFQVLARYVFRAVPVWTEEAARYCMVWGGLLGATVAFRADSDPRIVQKPTKGPKAWVISTVYIRAIATVLFLGPVLYHSRSFIERSFRRVSDGLEISMAVIVVAVPISVVIIFIHLAARLLGAEKAPGKS